MPYPQTKNSVTLLLTFSFAVLGITFLLGANPGALTATFGFYELTDMLSASTLSVLTGIGMLSVTITTLAARIGVLPVIVPVSITLITVVVPLLTLLSPTRWMADLGGFPIIGSGQGIIKYFAVLPLVAFLFFKDKFTAKQHTFMNYASVAVVLFWIGGMKFYEFEANGIIGLVETSPFMSWLYDVFTVQQASNVIGGFDILFAILLGIGIFIRNKPLLVISGLACLSVFVMTQTFMFSVPGTFNGDTLINGLGHFVIKDLWFIANLIIVAHYTLSNDSEHQAKL
ncbi:hypothetical protein MTsDn1_12210 [Alteromonas sp. MTD1]|uniref:DUF417 family protein n=1 Tax=Alteromonas sp. MTD1 TaxID=3057962 RepID=UPI0036F2F360